MNAVDPLRRSQRLEINVGKAPIKDDRMQLIPSALVAAMVRFTPGARTNWHSHPLGQTLHCTDGVGFVATRDGHAILMRPGDTVHTPPGEEHWHGATRSNMMCHLALVERHHGQGATWLEPVNDQDYETAHQTKETHE